MDKKEKTQMASIYQLTILILGPRDEYCFNLRITLSNRRHIWKHKLTILPLCESSSFPSKGKPEVCVYILRHCPGEEKCGRGRPSIIYYASFFKTIIWLPQFFFKSFFLIITSKISNFAQSQTNHEEGLHPPPSFITVTEFSFRRWKRKYHGVSESCIGQYLASLCHNLLFPSSFMLLEIQMWWLELQPSPWIMSLRSIARLHGATTLDLNCL